MGRYTSRNSTGDAGEYLTGYAFAGKLGWAYRILDSDTGVDGEVEIYDGEQPTGKLLKVQVKSTVKPRNATPGDAAVAEQVEGGFKVSVKKTDVDYWMKLALPVVLCAADIGAGRVCFRLMDETVVIPVGGEKTFSVDILSANEVAEPARTTLLSHSARPFDRLMQTGQAKLEFLSTKCGLTYAFNEKRPIRDLKNWHRDWSTSIRTLISHGALVLSEESKAQFENLSGAINQQINRLDFESREWEL